RWVSDFFSYETTKSVVVKSWVVGAVNRGVQLLILAYFVGGWPGGTRKGLTKCASAGNSGVPERVTRWGQPGERAGSGEGHRWAQGTGGAGVLMGELGVPGVRGPRGADGNLGVPGVSTRVPGPRGAPGDTDGGMLTGRCVSYNATLSTCEIQGWCPPEVDTVDVPIMLEAENFTLLIKNSIRFPLFGFEKTNLPPPGSGSELGRCRFHPQ
ncbi:P2RX3 protein, partial [Ptilonorhynchus violaceus]|nr:P2RX3 protein [Ptilonorhynchus violaceus]